MGKGTGEWRGVKGQKDKMKNTGRGGNVLTWWLKGEETQLK